MLTVTATASCRHCGGELETKDEIPSPGSAVTCKACGAHIGIYDEVSSQSLKDAETAGVEFFESQIDAILNNTLGRLPNVKITKR